MTAKGVAVVTGASAGVGRAVVRAFAHAGYDVGLVARGSEGLEADRCEAEAAGVRASVAVADVADATAVDAAAAQFERDLGAISVWINVAFSNVFAEFTDLTAAEYRRITEVTYLGYVHGTMAALRYMMPRNRGLIVQVGSALSYRSIPLQSAYCGAKAAIRGFTDSLRSELLHHKSRIRLSLALLPAVNTPQFSWCRSKLPRRAQPVPPIYQPEVIARAILWLARHPRRELPIGWPVVKALLGQMLVPGYVDRVLAKSGYESQQYDGARPVEQPDNLEHPLPGDWGAHGDFDARSRARSWHLWLVMNKTPLVWAAITLSIVALGFRRARLRGSQ